MKHILRLSALALGTSLLRAAWGGSSNDEGVKVTAPRVYVMGDSLADGGSFGFKFTTQTSDEAGRPILKGEGSTLLWVDYVAANATRNAQPWLCNAVSINAGTGAVTPNAGCTNFAIAGALAGPAGGNTSVLAQMQHAAGAVAAQGGYQADDLVLIDGGANDMVALLTRIAASSAAGAPVNSALGAILAAPDLATAQAAVPALGSALTASGNARAGLVAYLDSVLDGAAAAALPAGDAEALAATLAAMASAPDLATLQAYASQLAASLGAAQAQTQAAVPQLAVSFGGRLAAALAAGVQSQLVGQGAQRVAVLNLPAILSTPRLKAILAAQPPAQATQTAQLLTTVMNTFNQSLQQALGALPQALYIDFYSEFEQQVADPDSYGLGNVSTPVCPVVHAADGSEDNAATFTRCTLAAAAAAQGLTQAQLRNTFYPANAYDASLKYYTFADAFHPTAVAHQRISQLVSRELAKRGWL